MNTVKSIAHDAFGFVGAFILLAAIMITSLASEVILFVIRHPAASGGIAIAIFFVAVARFSGGNHASCHDLAPVEVIQPELIQPERYSTPNLPGRAAYASKCLALLQASSPVTYAELSDAVDQMAAVMRGWFTEDDIEIARNNPAPESQMMFKVFELLNILRAMMGARLLDTYDGDSDVLAESISVYKGVLELAINICEAANENPYVTIEAIDQIKTALLTA